jgi:putative FmdB family regulatory protein
MPTYEYECTSCGKSFDAFQSMSDAPLSDCPSCGMQIRRRIHGGTGIIFKGSGFYKNDSRKSDSGTDKSSSSSSSAASAPAAAPCNSCPAAPACDSPKKESV